MLFGHLAVSALQHHYLKADLAPAVVAGFFPDLVDKTLCRVLHLTPGGRTLGHTLAAMGLSTTVVRLLWGRRAAWSWELGYLGHLIGDVGGFIPWLYPLVAYDFPRRSFSLWEIARQALTNPSVIGPELALSAWAAYAWWRGGSVGDPRPTKCEAIGKVS